MLIHYESKLHSTQREDQDVRDSSQEANLDSLKSGLKASKKEIVFNALKKHGASSRRMLSEITAEPVNVITQMVADLMDDNKILESRNKLACGVSGRNVYYLKVAEI